VSVLRRDEQSPTSGAPSIAGRLSRSGGDRGRRLWRQRRLGRPGEVLRLLSSSVAAAA